MYAVILGYYVVVILEALRLGKDGVIDILADSRPRMTGIVAYTYIVVAYLPEQECYCSRIGNTAPLVIFKYIVGKDDLPALHTVDGTQLPVLLVGEGNHPFEAFQT